MNDKLLNAEFLFPEYNLSLALLKTRVLFVDYVQFSFTADDLTISAAFFNGCSYFHIVCFEP